MVTEVTTLEFGDLKKLGPLLFLVSGAFYLATISGNVLSVVLLSTQQGLQTTMYFFLANFSCLKICYTSNILTRMLVGLLRKNSDFHGKLYYSALLLWDPRQYCMLSASSDVI